MSEQLNPGIVFYRDTQGQEQEGMVSVKLPNPQPVDPSFPYQDTGDSLVERCLAAWDNAKGRLPMAIRFVGPAGVGKNAVVYHLANKIHLPLYIMQGHEELTPEDIVVSGAIRSDGDIEYIASPLVSAMVEGAICFFDEIGKVRPRGLSALASVLDERRRIYSGLLGRWIAAHRNFRFCSALNPEDPETFDLPLYLISRTLEFSVRPPSPKLLVEIVKKRNTQWENNAKEALNISPGLSPRDLLDIADYASRIKELDPGLNAVEIAIEHCTGNIQKNGSKTLY